MPKTTTERSVSSPQALRGVRAAGAVLAAVVGLGAGAGCEAKVQCAVQTRETTVGDEKRLVFVVVNRGTEPIVDAQLQVTGKAGEGEAALSGPFSAVVTGVEPGKEKQIAVSLLRTADDKPVEGELAVEGLEVLAGGKAACTGR